MRHALLATTALLSATLAAADPWPDPAMPIGQSAPRWRSFVPKSMELVGQPVTLASDVSPTPVQAILLRDGERHALLVGTTTATGRFEAWHWATFMNCAACLDDPTAHTAVRMSGRGKVLSITTAAASVREQRHWRHTWRLRERAGDGRLELVGEEALAGIEGRQATRRSVNLLNGETVTDTGTLRGGRLGTIADTRRGKAAAAARPAVDAMRPAF